eukprot:IDg21419t1
MEATGIASRAKTGKLMPCPEKKEFVEREVAYHLGFLYESGALDEDCVFNADETHFVVDLNDGRTLAMKGDTNVKFADVGVPDTVPGVCYRSGPKGWMDARVFGEWLNEK